MKDVENKSDMRTEFHSDVEGLTITRVLSTFIYRVFQEVLDNSMLHAHALNLSADLSISDGMLMLVINDDGSGISQADIASAESLSLQWMKERAIHFGGKIEIIGEHDKGTKVTLRIPVSSA